MRTTIFLAGLLFALSFPASGALYNYGTLAGGSAIGAIPDNNILGLSDAHTLSGLGTSLTDVNLTIVLQGGFSSDLSGYLRLGNLSGSTAYTLTSLVQGQTLSESSANTYSVDLGSTFSGQNPNDTWTLFFADGSAGGVTTLNGWSLDITAVPEPITIALSIFGGLMIAAGVARRFGTRPPRTFA